MPRNKACITRSPRPVVVSLLRPKRINGLTSISQQAAPFRDQPTNIRGYGKASTRQLHSNTHCCIWRGHARKQSNSVAPSSMNKKVGTRCRSPSYERFLEGCSSPIHATRRTPHGASRLVQAMSTWSVKARHAPSRHSRIARVDGRTTTAMHDNRVHPIPILGDRWWSQTANQEGDTDNSFFMELLENTY